MKTAFSLITFSALFLPLVGCNPLAGGSNYSKITYNHAQPQDVLKVQKIEIVQNNLKITGSGLSKIISVKVKQGTVDVPLKIAGISSTELIATPTSQLQFVSNKLFDLILGTVEASTTYQIIFTPDNNSITAAMLTSMGASSGQVLKYNGSAWVPSTLANSQIYKGTWDANANNPDLSVLSQFQTGDYYIVNQAGNFEGISYNVGDWAIFNGSSWEKADNSSNVVSSFNGRRGSVTLQPGDYVSLKNATTHKVTGSSINDLADIDLTTIAPTNGQYLKYDGTKWIPGTVDSITAGSIGTNEIANGAVTFAKLNLNDGDIPQAKVNGLATALAGKEPTLNAGVATQYFRGDKTWQTLDTSAVPENGNLYFTNARVLGLPLTGLSSTNATMAASDTVLQAFGKAQGQISAHTSSIAGKADQTNVTQTITAASVTGLSAPVAGSDAANKTYVDAQVSGASNQWTASSGNIYRSSGNVGIGISSPTSKLHIVSGTNVFKFNDGASSITPNISVESTSGKALALVAGTSGSEFAFDSSGFFDIGADTHANIAGGSTAGGTSLMRITGAGNVGIGTTNPASLLEVNGNITLSSGAARTIQVADVTGSLGQALTIKAGSNLGASNHGGGALTLSAGNGYAAGSGGAVSISAGNTTGNASGGAVTITAGSGGGNNSGANVTILGGAKAGTGTDGNVLLATTRGYVGVGTTSPGRTLEVIGSVRATPTEYASLNTTVGLNVNRTVNDSTFYIGYRSTPDAWVLSGTYSTTGAFKPLVFATSDTERLRIDNSGNVGIGTTSPSQKLSVAGTIESTSGGFKFPDGTTMTTAATAAPVTSVNGSTGAITLTTSNITEGTNLYYTDTRAIAAPLTGLSTSTNSAVTATDTILSGLGKLQAQISNFLSNTLTGLTSTSGNIAATDSVLTAFGKLLNTQTDYVSKTANSTVSGQVTFNTIGTLNLGYTPTNLTDATNKSYVDTQVASAGNQWTASSGNVYRSSGNVGVGTTSPTNKLEVNGYGKFTKLGVGGDVFSAAHFLDVYSTTTNVNVGLKNSVGWSYFGTDNNNLYFGSDVGTTGFKFLIDRFAPDNSFLINSSGNVGIGTTSPGYLLDVNGSQRVVTSLGVGTAPSGVAGRIDATVLRDTNNNWIDMTTGSSIQFKTSSNTRMSIANSGVVTVGDSNNNVILQASGGKVGIGITNPQAAFHTKGTSNYGQWRLSPSSAGAETSLGFFDDTAGTSTNTAWIIGQNVWGSTGKFGIGNENAGGGGNVRLTIQRDGNVGIGTTSPGGVLSVDAGTGTATTNKIQIKSRSNSYGQVQIMNDGGKEVSLAYIANGTAFGTSPTSSSGSSFIWNQGVGLYTTLGNQYSLANASYGGPSFLADSNGGISIGSYAKTATVPPAEGLIINGNVGVGTTSPSYKLHVVGSSGTTVGYFSDGTATCSITPATAGSVSCSSDERLKKNIVNLDDLVSLENVLKLRTVTYEWKNIPNGKHTGYIAQEVEKVAPEFVTTGKDGYKQVSYAGFIPWITGAIKAFYKEFKALVLRVAKLEDQDVKRERDIASLKEDNKAKEKKIRYLEQKNEELNSRLEKIEKLLKK